MGPPRDEGGGPRRDPEGGTTEGTPRWDHRRDPERGRRGWDCRRDPEGGRLRGWDHEGTPTPRVGPQKAGPRGWDRSGRRLHGGCCSGRCRRFTGAGEGAFYGRIHTFLNTINPTVSMTRFTIVIFAFFIPILAWANFAIFQTASQGSSYVGLIDQYPSEGWTDGWSVYSPSSSYAGNFAVIERTSDNATTAIEKIDPMTHAASASQFNSFCAGTYCYVETLYDSIGAVEGHENDSTQATLVGMPQIAVGADGLLEICGAPNSSMTNSYSASQSTAKVELFAVAYAATLDWNGWQTNLPYFIIAGNTSTSNYNITNVRIWRRADVPGLFNRERRRLDPGQPGVQNITHAGAIWWDQFTRTPTGGSTTLNMLVGFNNFLNETGDTFHLTNSVIGGAWIVAGPASDFV